MPADRLPPRHPLLAAATPATVLAIALVAGGCGSSPTGSGVQLTHPAGEIEATVSVPGSPYGVAVSSTGTVYVAQLANSTLGRADLPSTAVQPAVAVGWTPSHVAFDPTGARAYVANQSDGTIGVVDVATDQQVALLQVRDDAWNVIVSPNGQRVYATTDQGELFIFNAATRQPVDTVLLGANDALRGLAFAPTGARLYVAGRNSGTIYEVDVVTRSVVRTFPVGGTPQRMAVSRGGSTLYVANEAGGIDVVHLADGSVGEPIDVGGAAYGLALTPDGTQLYATLPDLGRVAIVDVSSGEVVDALELGGRPRNVAFTASGDRAVITNEWGNSVTFVH